MNNVGSRSENSMSMLRKMKGGDGIGGISHKGSGKKFWTLTCRYLISHNHTCKNVHWTYNR